MELALEVKFYLDFHDVERWPTEVTSNTYFRGIGQNKPVNSSTHTFTWGTVNAILSISTVFALLSITWCLLL